MLPMASFKPSRERTTEVTGLLPRGKRQSGPSGLRIPQKYRIWPTSARNR